VKLITLKNGRIIGCSIVGPNAGDQIALWTLAVTRKLKVSAIAGMVLPYPTFGEAGKRAAMTYYAGVAQKPFIRKVIGFLKNFG
jgi:pyruvate/2-oxoglutarate dehydrogenase complex dihydrolipoamide dehydrogenase (E3) component